MEPYYKNSQNCEKVAYNILFPQNFLALQNILLPLRIKFFFMKKTFSFFLFSFFFFGFSQQYPKIDFIQSKASLEINPIKQNVVGEVTYTFVVNELLDTIRIDARKMSFNNVKINGNQVNFKSTNSEFLLFDGYEIGENTLSFSYEAFPTEAMYFVQKDNYQDVQIWTQGQGKYTSNWFPSFDDLNEKVIFGLTVTFNKDYTVLSNGKLVNKEEKDDQIIWEYQMQKPMSSYLLMLAIGRFEKHSFTSKSGIPNDLWLHFSDIEKFEPTYRYSKEIFDYLENEIYVAYPWEVYRQVPVWDFMYGGMENTTSTVFAQDYVVDNIGFNDMNYVNVNAHELAHQWFGDMITSKNGKDHWLHEGFATFYALLTERHLFGDDYYYWQLYQHALQIEQAEASDDIPILSEKASTLSYYQKGALALHILRENVGKKKFRLAIKNYLNKYAFSNAETEDLLREIRAVSDYDVDKFRKNWLETPIFQKEETYNSLRKNEFIKQYLDGLNNPIDPVKYQNRFLGILKDKKKYYPVKELIIYQTVHLPFKDRKKLLDAAMKTGNINVRQAVASTFSGIEIPKNYRKTYETLLEDNSYITREIALSNLWINFKSERERYIELSKDWIGSETRNLEILHHTLSMVTTKSEEQQFFSYLRLLNLSGTNYNARTRQRALESLLISLDLKTPDVFKSLAYGTSHFGWGFSLFCKKQIEKLIENEDYREIFQNEILLELPLKEKIILDRILSQEKKTD